jgi:hypothetical protein
MNCLEFRRHAGAEPFSTAAEAADHRGQCAACARYQAELQAMDRLLGKAMRIDLAAPGIRRGRSAGVARPARPASTNRWLAMAASLVLGVLAAGVLWVSYPSPTLAAEVIGHAGHEPGSWASGLQLDGGAVEDVLRASHVRLRPGLGPVTFARRCFFAGHWVPHLVVQTESGPVTVFLLGHREVAAATRMDEDGYSALVVPAPRGSIAVVSRDERKDLDAIAKKVLDEVEWDA